MLEDNVWPNNDSYDITGEQLKINNGLVCDNLESVGTDDNISNLLSAVYTWNSLSSSAPTVSDYD